MREFEDAPPMDCPACGAPTAVEFTPDARCPACDAGLVDAAEAARVAISSLQSALRDLPALPPRLQASLKARLFEFDQSLDAAIAAPVAAPEPVEAPVAEPTAAVEEPVSEPAEEPVSEPAEEPVSEPAEEPVSEPAEEPAAEPVEEPPVTQITPPAEPAEPAEPANPGLWQRLGPAFAENLMFFLGGFLLLAGALYFVSTAWTTMTGASQLLVIEGGILCFGASLVGAGRLLNRDDTLDDLDRVLATAGGACTAFAALAVGRLLHTDLLSGFGGLAVWLAAGFAINTWALRRLGLIDRQLAGGLMLACLGAVIAPIFIGWPVALAALCVAIATALAWRQEIWPAHALAVIAAGVAVVQVALHTDAWGVLALPLAGAAIVYSRQARTRAQAHDLFAVGLAVAAFVIGLLSPNAALLCAAAGCIVAARAGVHRERAGLLIAAFVLGLAAYVLLPAPIRGIVLALKAKAAAGLGYSGGRLPLAWYGVTCLPYVALCGLAAHRLAKAGLDSLARVARGWTLGVAAALCVLAFTTLDLRAPLLVLPAEGLLLLGLAFWLKSTRMAYTAPVLLAAAPILAVLHFHLPTSVVPLGIAAIALILRFTLRRGPVVHALYQSCACLLAGAAGMAIVPPAFMDQAVHWIDLIAAPLLVLAIWPVPQLRPLGLLALHRMIPALASLTGIWAWPAALIVAIGATIIVRGHARDRLGALSGWALVLVAISGVAYAPPFGVDATIGLLGVAVLGVALAWGTAHSTLAAVGLLAFAGAAASVAWICELRPSRIGMAAAVALSLGVVALGWLHRRKDAIFARIGLAPTRMALVLAGLAVLAYIVGDAEALIKKRSLITLGAGVLFGMVAAPRLPRHVQPWTLIGAGAAWLLMRGVLGVLPWATPIALAAVLAGGLFALLVRYAPRFMPDGVNEDGWSWRHLVFAGLILSAGGPPTTLLDAVPLALVVVLCLGQASRVAQALMVSALALLVAGPILTPLVGAHWAPIGIFVLAIVGMLGNDRNLGPRGFGQLGMIAIAVWAVAFGPTLIGAVFDGQIRVGDLSVGVGWIACAATIYAVLEDNTPKRLIAALPLLWWAPIAGFLGDGPTRAAPAIAALALVTCALRSTRPALLWAHLVAAAALTIGVWDHALTPVTGALIAATLGLAGWRYGRRSDAEGAPIMIAVAGVVGVVWNAQGGPMPLGQIGVALGFAALVGGVTRRHIVTVFVLSGAAMCAAGAQCVFDVNVPAVITGVLVTAGLAARAWRMKDVASREAAAVVGASAAAMLVGWIWPNQPSLMGLAVLATVFIAAWLRCTGVTVGALAGIGAVATVLGQAVGWPGVVGGVMLAAAPWILWWRRRSPSAIGGAMFALAGATLLWLVVAHDCDLFDTPLWTDGMWTIAVVACLAAVLKRSTGTILGLIALPILLTGMDPIGLRTVLAMLLTAAALGLHGRQRAWSFDVAFGPLAYAAALAVAVGLGAPIDTVSIGPWIAAAIGGVAVVAALTGRRLITLASLALAMGLFSALQTESLGTALGGLGVVAAFAIRAWRSRQWIDEAFAWCAAPLAAAGLVGWLLGLPADLPLLAFVAGFAGLTSAFIARRRVSQLAIAAGLIAVAWGSMLLIGWAGMPIGVGGFALIAGTAAMLIGWAPRLDDRPKTVHGLVIALACLHLALAQATPWLGMLTGHHLEVWVALAALAAATSSLLPEGARKTLIDYFVAIPLLALVNAVFLSDAAAPVARAAFLGSVTWAIASRDRRVLRYAAFVLANIGAWAFWLTLDLVDPTLYGLPPGLTLLALAEVERARLSPKAHLALLVGGFALAYGGMAVQIVTVGGALHAALLLVAGLISVGLGWRARRADLLIGGTAAVVLDVICYLVRHGFQQNFISAGLLLFAGATVLLAATVAAKMRRSAG